MRHLTHTIAALLALVILSACVYFPGPTTCEGPFLERAFLGVVSFGLNELVRSIDCLEEDELHNLKIKAREGEPDSQAVHGAYFFWNTSVWHTDYERFKQTGTTLIRCAADGGSHAAQASWLVGFYLQEPEASKTRYKYTTISIEREGCDCESLFEHPPYLSLNKATNNCFFRLCSPMRDAKNRLTPAQVAEANNDISIYKPSPRPCNVE